MNLFTMRSLPRPRFFLLLGAWTFLQPTYAQSSETFCAKAKLSPDNEVPAVSDLNATSRLAVAALVVLNYGLSWQESRLFVEDWTGCLGSEG